MDSTLAVSNPSAPPYGAFFTAACNQMAVAYREASPGCELRERRDEIVVVVPTNDGAFRAQWEAHGRACASELRAPEVAIVPPARSHSLACDGPAGFVCFALDGSFVTARARAELGRSVQIAEWRAAPDPYVRGIAQALRSGFRVGRPPGPAYLSSLAGELAVHLASRYGAPKSAGGCGGLAPHKLNRVLALIDERLGEALQVRDLAEAVHMSPFHFARMFKHTTGQAPHLFITWQRMDRARKLLAESALPLAEVATRVGYQTQAHFTGVFHAHVGTTPRAYRLRFRGAARPAEPPASYM